MQINKHPDKTRRPKIINGKKQCWEFMGCGREPGGSRMSEEGVCPASTAEWLDGVHEGKNGGRACWVIAGTLSTKGFDCSYSRKFKSCGDCDFLRRVVSEEYPDLQTAMDFIGKGKT